MFLVKSRRAQDSCYQAAQLQNQLGRIAEVAVVVQLLCHAGAVKWSCYQGKEPAYHAHTLPLLLPTQGMASIEHPDTFPPVLGT